MSAADDYPWMAYMASRPNEGMASTHEATRSLAEIDALRAENARLKAQLADAREADAALHDWITNGGRI